MPPPNVLVRGPTFLTDDTVPVSSCIRDTDNYSTTTIGSYLLSTLQQHGVKHIFGVPGDFVLTLMQKIPEHDNLHLINTCDEQGAGFAADAYARVNGLGVVCVTYGVGGLKLANTTAQAYAELSPVVVISGAPAKKERDGGLLVHHRVRGFETQMNVFKELTVDSCVLDDKDNAVKCIDRVLKSALRYKRPVYIEVPRDMVEVVVEVDGSLHGGGLMKMTEMVSCERTLDVALKESLMRINKAKSPVILAGEEIHRFRLQDRLLDFVNKANIPVATSILGKSVIDELHPAFMGVYQGGIGSPEVRHLVETSDCIIILGVLKTDMNMGVFTAKLDREVCVHAFSEKISVAYQTYEQVQFAHFIDGLAESDLVERKLTHIPALEKRLQAPYKLNDPARPVTSKRLFERLQSLLTKDVMCITDVGDSLFAAADLVVHHTSGFLSPAYYCSLGFSVPAALGVQMAKPHLRPLVLVGDGAFQMTGMELSSIVHFNCNPIIVLLNNSGYATERFIKDGSFNDLHNWNYHKLTDVLGVGKSFLVKTEGEMDKALTDAVEHTESFCLLEIVLGKYDVCETLQRLSAGLR